MTSKPAIILVPGAWHSPEHFAPTTELLEQAGYSVHGVRLPSVRDEPPFPTSHHPDREAVCAAILSALDDEGKDVLLVMHSYGGIPGSDACDGLSKGDRAKEGKATGVVGLVYIASFALQEGQNLLMARGSADGGARPKWQHFEEDHVIALSPLHNFYHDVPRPLAEHALSLLKKHARGPFTSTASYAAWKHIPSTYIVTDDDQIGSRAVRERMARQEGGQWGVGNSLGEIHVMSGHSPFLSKPEWMSRLIRKVSGEEGVKLGDENVGFVSQAGQREVNEVSPVLDFRAGGMEFVKFVRQNERKLFSVGGKWQHRLDFRDTGKGFADLIRMNYMPKDAAW